MGAMEVQDTTTTLASSLNPSVYGQPVTFTATVSPVLEPGSVAPTGTVTFYDNGTAIGTGTLAVVGGVDEAAFTTSTLPTGTASITAAYTSGDATFTASAASTAVSLVVNQNATVTALGSASPNPSVYGQAVTLTATVTRGARLGQPDRHGDVLR